MATKNNKSDFTCAEALLRTAIPSLKECKGLWILYHEGRNWMLQIGRRVHGL